MPSRWWRPSRRSTAADQPISGNIVCTSARTCWSLAAVRTDLADGRRMAERAIADGTAFEKFRVLVEAQGGDVSYVDDTGKLPRARLIATVASPRTGWLTQIDARAVGEAAVALGAGRSRKTDPVDHAVGFVIHHKVGDHVRAGSASLHCSCQRRTQAGRSTGAGARGAMRSATNRRQPCPSSTSNCGADGTAHASRADASSQAVFRPLGRALHRPRAAWTCADGPQSLIRP